MDGPPRVQALPTPTAKRQRTQWAAQFLAAAELVRRGYTVSFTMGNNTPVADLMVGTPKGQQFWVDVKGLAGKNDWLVKPKDTRIQLYYVLVHLAPLAGPDGTRQPDRFFVLKQAEANHLEEEYRRLRPHAKGTIPGFSYKDALPYEDCWISLPLD